MEPDGGIGQRIAAVLEAEPPFAGTPGQVRSRAKRVRRGRRTAAVVSGACVIGLVGALFSMHPLGDSTQVDATDRAVRSDFSPDELADVIGEHLESVDTSIPEAGSIQVVARDAQDNPIEGDDRDKATTWTGTREISDAKVFEIRLSGTDAPAWETLKASCADEAAAGVDLACTAAEIDGALQVTYTRAVRRQTGAWAVVLRDRLDQAKGVIWYERGVRTYRENGVVVSAIEFVHGAASVAAVDDATADLAAMTADEQLTFPTPARDADEDCGWVVPEADASHTCVD